jgi:hypothetical protein
MHSRITRWIERLPETTTTLTLRAGDDRRNEDIIEKWAVPIDDIDDIIDTVSETMAEELTGRLIAYDTKGIQKRSMSVRGSQPTRETTTSEVGMLVEGLIRMSEEQRRFLATITDSFQTMHDTIQDAIFQEREHHEEMADAQLALALSENESQKDSVSTTDRALGLIAQAIQSKTHIDIDDVANNLSDEQIEALMQNEKIVTKVMDFLQK